MSTTFEVYPRTKTLPTFGAIVDRSTMELHRFLDSVGISSRPEVHMRLQACVDDAQLPFSLNDPAKWNEETYAWFMVSDVPGGTDAYFDDKGNEIQDYWDGELAGPRCKRFESLIRECAMVGHRWWFRRSIGQPAIVNLAYGLIAGSLAAITNGLVYSMDSAWDYEKLPALPDDFLSWYFRPNKTTNENYREWSSRCLDHLAEELGGAPTAYGN
jgi:antitoxin component of RelBE/YafQ-DinJ toxin-antitoxin module